MIQLNLLPDVKMEYVRAQRSRRLMTTVSILVTAVSVGLLVLMLAANGLQKKHLNDLSTDIQERSRELAKQPQIDRILTVQNQLSSLNSLHEQKPAAAKMLEYMNQVTPSQVAINNLRVDLTAQTITIIGSADAISSVNKYVDTLKFTTYKIKGEDGSQPAFTDVVLTSFGIDSENSNGKPASYTIDLKYDPVILDITQVTTLTVPKQTTTRSELARPTELFEATEDPAGGNN